MNHCERAVPCAAIRVSRGNTVLFDGYFGRYCGGDPLEPASYTTDEELPVPTDSSRFDLASLTKFLATAPLILSLVEHGNVYFSTRIGEILTGLTGATAALTIEDLLTHSGGLPALPDLWQGRSPEVDQREEARARLFTVEPTAAPGRQIVYSCTGFILLGEVVQTVCGQGVAAAFSDFAGGAAGRDGSLGFSPTPSDRELYVPTEWCSWRQRRVQGTVHDENAHVLGGAAGNAGLFGTLPAVHELFLREWGAALGVHRRDALLTRETVLAAVKPRRVLPLGSPLHDRPRGSTERRGLGMQIVPDTQRGGFGAGAFGHTGFTGTSVWGDPATGVAVTILTSRLYYGRESTTDGILAFRRLVHESALRRYG